MGRPEKPVDWKKVNHLLMAGCKGTEIAPHFDMNVETFYRKVEETYSMGFTEYSRSKREHGESLLRVRQFEKALGISDKGDNTMMIWLGKQRLDQHEPDSTTTYVNQSATTRYIEQEKANADHPANEPEAEREPEGCKPPD